MFKRNFVVVLAAAGSLAAAQSALAAQPSDFGFDPWYVFGASRTVDAKSDVAQPGHDPFGYDPYYVLGTAGDEPITDGSPMETAEHLRNALGEQAGA